MKFFVLLLLLFSSLCFGASSSTTNRLQHAFEEYLGLNFDKQLPGYAVGYFVEGESFIRTEGVRQLGSTEKIDENTVFRLASVSKTFTPAAVAILGNKTLNFDSKITHYLSNLKLSHSEYQSQLTIRHLLSHSSGMMPHSYTNLIEANVPYQKILKQLYKVDFICQPGKCYGYQNVIYSLVGDVITKASNSSYEKIVEDKLFTPLGMQRSSFGLKNFLAEQNRATPHRHVGKGFWKAVVPKRNYYQLSPAAGVNASIKDMMQWLKAQLGHYPQVLTLNTLDTIQQPAIKTTRERAHFKKNSWKSASDPAYALGWRTFKFKGENGFVHHGGWVEGFRVEMVFNRRLDMGMVFLTHSEPRRVSDLVPRFIKLYLETFSIKP
ncbi:MAG: serine hydrolase domain-containing protein [Pseudomonadota bacterium]